MDVFSSSPACSFPVRSNSVPTRSNILVRIVDVALQKLKSWLEASAASTPSDESLSNALDELADVFSSVEDLLQVPATRRAIRCLRGKKCVDDVLDGYVELLDACNVIRELLLITKEQSQGLHSALRRRGANRRTSCCIDAFIISRNSRKKVVHRCQKELNQVSEECSCPRYDVPKMDPETLAVVKVMNDVIVVPTSVLTYLLAYFLPSCGSWCPWTALKRFLLMRKVAAVENRVNRMNVLSRVDESIRGLQRLLSGKGGDSGNGVATREVQVRLKAVEDRMDNLETRLEGVFKGMIQNRVSLLNIITP